MNQFTTISIYRGSMRAVALVALSFLSSAFADPVAEPAAAKTPETKAPPKLQLPGITLNVEQHCVDVDATICLEKGALELIACTKKTKEHESMVVVDARPMHIHTALLLLGAKNGSPASRRLIDEATRQWVDIPPQGDPIGVFLVVKNAEGKMIERPIGDFISRSDEHEGGAEEKTDDRKVEKFPSTFVFAGSLLGDEGKTPREYLADSSGSVISISTFGDELLCLSELESQDNGALMWQVNTNEIPKLDTKVILRLRPQKPTQKK